MKSAYLIADEHMIEGRNADVYVFARVGLPRDHLFRYLREHSFINRANDYLTKIKGYRTIDDIR